MLSGLSAKTEANYAGFQLEYRGGHLREYRHRLAGLHVRAGKTEGRACYFVLQEYIAAFHDPHLFVYQNLFPDSLALAKAAAERVVERSSVSEAEAKAYFTAARSRLDPLEGVWTDGTLRVAVLPDSGRGSGHFIAVVLTSDTTLWQSGEIRAHFTRTRAGGYEGELEEKNLARRFVFPVIYKRTLLRFDPGMWALELPVASADSGLTSTVDPHLATLVWRGGTPVLSIPSNDPQYRSALNGIVDSNAAAMRRAAHLIIDIRGNEGGSSWVTDTVLPLMAGPLRAHQAAKLTDARILSSPDQIQYVKDRGGNMGLDSLAVVALLARMAAAPGRLVPLEDSIDRARSAADPAAAPVASDSSTGPLVGVLIDGGSVSAAEVFLQEALTYRRVTVFGLPSAGALDYQSTSIVRIGDSARRWYLGYPTVTASASLPRGGMRGKGIPPDRRVDWSGIEDPIGYVEQQLGDR